MSDRRELLGIIGAFVVGCVFTALIMLRSVYDPSGPLPETQRPPKAIVVYESAETPLPTQTYAARVTLETRGVDVFVIDDDVITGDGSRPVYLEKAIDAARERGLPALVIVRGSTLRAMPLPGTADEIVTEAMR